MFKNQIYLNYFLYWTGASRSTRKRRSKGEFRCYLVNQKSSFWGILKSINFLYKAITIDKSRIAHHIDPLGSRRSHHHWHIASYFIKRSRCGECRKHRLYRFAKIISIKVNFSIAKLFPPSPDLFRMKSTRQVPEYLLILTWVLRGHMRGLLNCKLLQVYRQFSQFCVQHEHKLWSMLETCVTYSYREGQDFAHLERNFSSQTWARDFSTEMSLTTNVNTIDTSGLFWLFGITWIYSDWPAGDVILKG